MIRPSHRGEGPSSRRSTASPSKGGADHVDGRRASPVRTPARRATGTRSPAHAKASAAAVGASHHCEVIDREQHRGGPRGCPDHVQVGEAERRGVEVATLAGTRGARSPAPGGGGSRGPTATARCARRAGAGKDGVWQIALSQCRPGDQGSVTAPAAMRTAASTSVDLPIPPDLPRRGDGATARSGTARWRQLALAPHDLRQAEAGHAIARVLHPASYVEACSGRG